MAQRPDDASYQVELFISCQHLKNMDVLSKSDPQVVVSSLTGPNSTNAVEVGRTEMILNNLNPKFMKTIKMRYYFEKTQKLRFEVYDVDNDNQPLNQQDFIGTMSCTLGEICGSKGQQLTKPLLDRNGHKHGIISVQAEDISQTEDEALFAFKGLKLAKMDFFGQADPYFILSRMTDNGTWLDIYKSEVLKVTANPVWKPFKMNVSTVCKNNYTLPLRFKCFDWNRITAHREIGEFQTNFKQLLESKAGLQLIHSQKKKHMGTIACDTKIKKTYSFLQYLAGGLEINLILGIDFTGSNGPPQNSDSLHYMGGPQMNQYEQAIRSVGEIVSYYDRDKLFPVFGFGAKLPPLYNQTVHCFPLNGNQSQPECMGVDGILATYRQAISTVQLNGPTYFAPIINQAASRYASEEISQTNQRYFILLMITDGEICDMNETISAIIRASHLPMSIIIVGVGSANFSNMNALDSDGGLLTQQNQVAMRDIVQFVPFSQFSSNYALLAEATLAEIPSQVCQYFAMKNILPREVIRVNPMQQNPELYNQVPNTFAAPAMAPQMPQFNAQQQQPYPQAQQQPYPQVQQQPYPQAQQQPPFNPSVPPLQIPFAQPLAQPLPNNTPAYGYPAPQQPMQYTAPPQQ